MFIDKTVKPRQPVITTPVTTIIKVNDKEKNWLFNIDPKMVDNGELTVTGIITGTNWRSTDDTIIPTLGKHVLVSSKRKYITRDHDYIKLSNDLDVVKERFLSFTNEKTEVYGCYPMVGVYGFDGNLLLDYSDEADKEIFNNASYMSVTHNRRFRINDIQKFFDGNIKVSKVYFNATVFSFRNNGKLYVVIEHYDNGFKSRYWDIYGTNGFIKSVRSAKLTEEVL